MPGRPLVEEIAALMDRHPEAATGPQPASPPGPSVTVPVTRWTLRAIPSPRGLPAGLPEPLAAGATLPATVPGCVHTDLMPHGLVGDIVVNGSEAADRWVLHTAWRYTTTIDLAHLPGPDPAGLTGPATGAGPADDGEASDAGQQRRAVLAFEGIDTIATVRVNGDERLSTSDMHRRFELDLTDDLAAGPVELTVDIQPAIEAAEAAEEADPLPRPDAYVIPYNQVRKMACSYGWDWGPVTGTAGLWRPVTLQLWSVARFSDLRVGARFSAGPTGPARTPVVEVTAGVETADPGGAEPGTSVTVEVTGPGDVYATGHAEVSAAGELSGEGEASVRVPVPGARTWHPVGDGDQPLYLVTVTLKDGAGRVLETRTRRVGFRTVELVQQDDDHGRSFELHVNGQRLWVRGLNWIPDDPYPSRLTRDRLRSRIEEAVAAGANLLRVWGGGIYESDDFYDLCDELGVLVWQDFLFACAAYPEDDATLANVRAEALDNVARLRHHAALAVWSGCNENLWGFEEWGWQEVLAGRPWGALYYRDTLPAVLAELDDDRPYVPGSPFSPGGRPERSDGPVVDDYSRGTVHIWDVWNRLDYEVYESKFPRFAAEFGYQAPASWPTLARAVGALDLGSGALQAEDERLEVHQKADDGQAKLRAGLERHFPVLPDDGPGWYYATQLTQARAVRVGIGHLRSLHETNSGTIWWQHNDMWPVISWSILDSAGRRKLAWYAMREVYQPRDVFVGPSVNGRPGHRTAPGDVASLLVTAVNDTDEAWTAVLALGAYTAVGEVRAAGSVTLDVPARGAARIPVVDALGELPADAVLVAVRPSGGHRATRWLVPDRELDLPQADLEVQALAAGPDEVEVTVTAAGLVRDLCLLAELAVPDAVVSEQLLTLLPGESATFVVSGPGAASVPAEQWSALLWHDARLR